MNTFSRRISQLPLEKRALLEFQLAQRGDFQESVAVIGMGCRFPQANSLEAFWTVLSEGIDAVTEVPVGRWQNAPLYDPNPAVPGKLSTRWGGFLDQVDQFDPDFFGISPREAKRMDPQQRLLLEVAWEALEKAGQPPAQISGGNVGIFLGISTSDYAHVLLRDREHFDTFTATGGACSIAANRLSYSLDLRGPSLSIDTACSSSLVALHLACQSLRQGECDMALSGATNLMLTPDLTIALSQANMMAADGQCKTFDASADGYVRGEGCGIVVLKRLSKAVKDRDNILALIRGSAVGQDGHSNGLTAPSGRAQQAVIRRALERANVAPERISYVEAHGTGTSLGDPIEVDALGAVLMPHRSSEQVCWLSSVKTNIGHLEPAAGIAGFIKVVLSLQHRKIAPHLHFKQLNPHISLAKTTFSIPTQFQPWDTPSDERRLAGISAFGFGGTNAHMILEEAPLRAKAEAADNRPLHLLTLSARSQTALRIIADRYQSFLSRASDDALADLCFTANTGRTHFSHRLALIAQSPQEMCDRLNAFLTDRPTTDRQISPVAFGQPLKLRPKIGFLFTGQGSQYTGMGRCLYETQPTFRQALDRCSEILDPRWDCSLLSVLYAESDSTLLHQTAYTQPALVAIEFAIAQLWQSWGIKPDVVMGHSVGEYTAACLAGSISLESVLVLAMERGRLMQSLPANGMMAAVFTSSDKLLPLIEAAPDVVIAALNGAENTVISGERTAVQLILDKLESEGIRVCPLRVSHAFHSPLMAPVVPLFKETVQSIVPLPPKIPVVANLTGQLLNENEPLDATYWCRHLMEPVQFSAGLESLRSLEVDILIEIGPHPTLSKMGSAALPDWPCLWMTSLNRHQDNWSSLLTSLQNLYISGVTIDWAGFDRDYHRHRIALPTYPFERETFPLISAPQASSHLRQHGMQENVANKIQTLTTAIDGILTSIRSSNRLFKGSQEPATLNSPQSLPTSSLAVETIPEMLQLIVSEVGRLPLAQVNFQSSLQDELGFDSLMLVEIRHQLISTYPSLKDLPIKLFFNKLTLGELAQTISQKLQSSVSKPPVELASGSRSRLDNAAAFGKFREWASEFSLDRIERIDRALVHKDNVSNVLVSRIEQLREDVILAEIVQDTTHLFFYEHAKDHVTGLYIIEATRQLATALSHLYYDVPPGMAFVLDEMTVQFYTFAETSQALFAITEISDKSYTDGCLSHMYATVSIIQNETTAAVIQGSFRTFSAVQYSSLRQDALCEVKVDH